MSEKIIYFVRLGPLPCCEVLHLSVEHPSWITEVGKMGRGLEELSHTTYHRVTAYTEKEAVALARKQKNYEPDEQDYMKQDWGI